MNLTCYIIDDEPLAIEVIRSHAEAYGRLDVLDTYQNAVEAFRALTRRRVDLIFLDIEMPRLSGLDLLRALEDPPRAVLTTAHRDYGVEGFELDVVDYLVKPISFERFLKAMAKVESRVGGRGRSASSPETVEEPLVVRVGGRRVVVPLADIDYVESRRDYVHIATSGGVIRTPCRIGDLAEELRPFGFLRIHRSFLVPVGRVETWSAREVRIGTVSLPIGRTYRAEVRRRLEALGLR